MVKKIMIAICLLPLMDIGWAQTISNDVLAINGRSTTAGAVILDFTVGELSVQTLSTAGNMITQGFHQTYFTTSSIEGSSEINISIHAYPNPTIDFVSIAIESDLQIDLMASVYDSYGRLIINNLQPNGALIKVDMTTLAAGTYYVKIAQLNSLIHIKTIKIQKLSTQ